MSEMSEIVVVFLILYIFTPFLLSFLLFLIFRYFQLQERNEIVVPNHVIEPRTIIVVHFTKYSTENISECIICQEQNDENSIVCECKNAYHVGCIIEWLSKKNTCPICRKEYTGIRNIEDII